MWTLGFPPTSITSTRCRSTISTTWPLLGCTTSLETMPQRKWWAPLCLHTINHVHLDELTATLLLVSEINLNTQQPGMTRVPLFFLISAAKLTLASFICHLLGCPWDQKLPISPVALAGSAESQPLPPRICSQRELWGLCAYFLALLSRRTSLH